MPKISRQQAERFCQEYAAGQSKMANLKSLWQSLLFYCNPAAEHLVWSRDTDKGEYDVPSDTTGIQSSNTMASGIYSRTVSRGDRVADLEMQDADLNRDSDVQEWLSSEITIASKLIHASNYPSSMFDMLKYFCVIGTDMVFSYYDENLQKLNFRPYRMFDTWIQENSSGKIDRVLRSEMIPHTIAEERWPNTLPEEIKKALTQAEGVAEDSEYIHVVEPNPDYIPVDSVSEENQKKARQAKHFKYREVWIHKESLTVMSEGVGFRTFPYHVARSGVQCDRVPFGRSPAMDALSDLREAHRWKQWFVDAGESGIRPPKILPKGSIDPDDWDDRPGADNVYNIIEGKGPEYMATSVDLRTPMEMYMATKSSIEEFFFVPLFRAMDQLSGNNNTTTEVTEVVRQSIQGIAPIIGTLEPDVFTTIVDRVLDLMDLYGLGTPKPDILRGKDIVINITSQLDAELQNTDIRRTNRALGQAFEIMRQFMENPEMNTLVDRDRIIRNLLYTNNVDPKAVFSVTEAKKKKAQLNEEMQMNKLTDGVMNHMGQIDPNKAPEPGSLLGG